MPQCRFLKLVVLVVVFITEKLLWRGLFVNVSAEICCPLSWSLSWAAICTAVSPPRCLIVRQLRRFPFLVKCLLLCFCGESSDGFCAVRLLRNSICLFVCVMKRHFVSCFQPYEARCSREEAVQPRFQLHIKRSAGG
uniref:Putative secreted protein n=1 Tax=Ixodes ricinus TaxID=34613 RepID=A0A6B0USE0_IXORI